MELPLPCSQEMCILDRIDVEPGFPAHGMFLNLHLRVVSSSCVLTLLHYSNPNIPELLECAFCSFASLTSETPLCLKDGESRIFDPQNGVRQDCSCEIPEPFDIPIETCVAAPTPSPAFQPQNGCVFLDANGQEQFFEDGDPLGDIFTTECGPASQFPCFCNVNVADKVECPRCQIRLPDSSLMCFQIGETKAVTDLNGQTQYCECTSTTELECSGGGGDGGGECRIGGTVVAAGDPFGPQFPGICGDSSEFPSICNPNIPITNQENPYCVIDDAVDGLTCIKDGGSLEYEKENGEYVRCTCTYTSYLVGGSTSCVETPRPTPTPPVTPQPTPSSVQPRGPTDAASAKSGSISIMLISFVSFIFVELI
jgi:hypothetical protein